MFWLFLAALLIVIALIVIYAWGAVVACGCFIGGGIFAFIIAACITDVWSRVTKQKDPRKQSVFSIRTNVCIMLACGVLYVVCFFGSPWAAVVGAILAVLLGYAVISRSPSK